MTDASAAADIALTTSPTASEDDSPRTVTKRRPYRRRQIIDAAIRLFNERGYHETSMNDIGDVVGISGPSIYRHFDTKREILETALQEAAENVLDGLNEIVETSKTPRETLELLIGHYIDGLLDYPAMSVMVITRRHEFTEAMRGWVSRRLRLYAAEWVHALLELRPELSEAEARVMVTSVFALSHSVDRFSPDLDRDRLARLLKNLALTALTLTERE